MNLASIFGFVAEHLGGGIEARLHPAGGQNLELGGVSGRAEGYASCRQRPEEKLHHGDLTGFKGILWTSPGNHFIPARRNICRRPWLSRPAKSTGIAEVAQSEMGAKRREIERFPSHQAFDIICNGLQRRSFAMASSPKNSE